MPLSLILFKIHFPSKISISPLVPLKVNLSGYSCLTDISCDRILLKIRMLALFFCSMMAVSSSRLINLLSNKSGVKSAR